MEEESYRPFPRRVMLLVWGAFALILGLIALTPAKTVAEVEQQTLTERITEYCSNWPWLLSWTDLNGYDSVCLARQGILDDLEFIDSWIYTGEIYDDLVAQKEMKMNYIEVYFQVRDSRSYKR